MSTGAGKGSATRPGDPDVYGTNHESIFGVRDHQAHAGKTTLIADPKTGELRELAPKEPRSKKCDNKNFRSKAMGCHPKQIPAWTEKYGPLGVKFAPNGDMILPDRQTKFKVMAMKGQIDHDEVRGGSSRTRTG